MSDTVRVLSTLALKGAVHGLADQYQAVGGASIVADFAPTLALLERLRSGEAADVVILTREGLDEVAREGRVAAESCVDLARSFVGIAVKAGAAHPDISTEAALRAALLGTRAVAYSRLGASGILFAKLIERLGIASDINARAVIIPQGFTAERLVSGEADLAVQQISELKQVGGSRWWDPFHTSCKRLRCFQRAEWRRRTSRTKLTGCCGFSRRPRSRRRCAGAGWNLEFHSLIKTTPAIRRTAPASRAALIGCGVNPNAPK
jgi:molybdate transport system substrate-binding protein